MHNRLILATPRIGRAALAIATQLVAAVALGAVILYGVGFSPMAAAHNAAHDSRHSHVFPCH